MKTKGRLLELTGAVMIAGSLALAILMHSKHFYAILIVGLFLVFFVVDHRLIKSETYLNLYKKFFIAGLIGDLIFGITITKLWFYNYESFAGYLVLYLVIYPVAGIVMLQTYLWLANKWLPGEGRRQVRAKFYKRASRICALAVLSFGLAALLTLGNHLLLLLFFSAAAAWALTEIAFSTHLHHRQNILDKFINHPFNIVCIILVATYVNAFLHELPNVKAHEWVYTNWPLANISIAGVPIVVLLVWPVLLLYPISVYYQGVSKKSKPLTRHVQYNTRPAKSHRH